MGYYVARLKRPYDYQVLIETYIYTHRTNFVHTDFTSYYASLLEALQARFGIRQERESLSFDHSVLWSLFDNTVRSLLQITDPWASYLEAGLIHKKLEESGEHGRIVDRASAIIWETNTQSEKAHREILDALFKAIFGECQLIMTSEQLRENGFDDSKEPDIVNYYDHM